jgi:hypothetical protein
MLEEHFGGPNDHGHPRLFAEKVFAGIRASAGLLGVG